MNVAEVATGGVGLIAAAVLAGALIALVGLAVVAWRVQRSRAANEARLDDIQSRVLQMAVVLGEQTQADGYEARIRLIRAAHAAMNEQASSRRRA